MMDKLKCLLCETEKDIKLVNLSENVVAYSCPKCAQKVKTWVRKCREEMER